MLICQECGGSGGYIDVILDDGSGPKEWCPFCDDGIQSPKQRGDWLTYKQLVKREANEIQNRNTNT